jgi:hypothetical protein
MQKKQNAIIFAIKQLGFMGSFNMLINFIFYRLKYIENSDGEVGCYGNGYYLVKRVWVWILTSPFIMLYFILMAIKDIFFDYIISIFSYRVHSIRTKKRKLSIGEKISYRKILFD